MKTDWKSLSDALWSRCGGRCERCRLALTEPWERHHRQLRKQGGRDELPNLLALHPWCHNQHPRSVHDNVRASFSHGFLVSAYFDPAAMPLLLGGRWVLLGETYTDWEVAS